MRRKTLYFTLIFLMVSTFLLITFWFARETRASMYEEGLKGLADAPHVTGIVPNNAPNDLNAPVVISGTGFTTGLTITLGSTVLVDSSRVSETILTSTIPWGLEPGVYTLTVQNPDGETGSLPNAFTVTQGIGVWASGGPYGGNVQRLTLHPIIPTTIYAVGSGGLFVSRDAMQHWEYLLPSPIPVNLSISPPEPNVLYFGTHFGLYRSLDGGENWDDITPPQHYVHGQDVDPLAHPVTPGVLYAAMRPEIYGDIQLEHTGVFRSDDYGATWLTMTNGLTDTEVTALAFYTDDLTYQHMVLGTANGNIFTSQDAGVSWQWAARPCDCIVDKLVVNPHNPQEVWVERLKRADIMVYKSLNANLTQWTPVDITQNPIVYPHTPIFDPWGTLWSDVDNSTVGFYTSTDGGATWQPMTSTLPGMTVVAFDPAQPDLIYAGSDCSAIVDTCGMYQSTDRGQSWQQSNEGFSGIEAYALAVSPADPQRVYAYTCDMRGLLRSNNGGASWQQMNVETYGYDCNAGNPNGLAVDPFTPTRVYLAGSTGNVGIDGLPAVEIVNGDGNDWHTAILPVPDPPEEWSGLVYPVAPHPHWPSRVLASIHYYHLPFDPENPQHTGGFAISHDYGEGWSQLIISDAIGMNASFAFDAADPNLVYAGTGAGPVLRSLDGGEHWQVLDSIPAEVDCTGGWFLAHPYQTGRVMAFCSRIMRSLDGGETWAVSDREIWNWGIYVPTIPAALYWAEWLYGFGLVRSLDDGETWEPVEGIPADARIYAMASGYDDQRVILYVSYTGGFGVLPTAVRHEPGMGLMSTGPSAGVYRLTTILSPPRVFLPLVGR
jgi:photosystem II stability/assembly factor-like uncharacterized protein